MPDDVSSLWFNALQVAYENPILYRIQAQEVAADSAYAANVELWKQIYPKVELLATDNPEVDFRLLTMPWSVSYGNPPLVFLSVTPRKKELPKTTGFLQTAAMFAPIIAAIPVVGPALSIALSVASAADQASRIKAFIGAATSITASFFEPQYYPKTFPVMLPLDDAQVAVDQPWLLPKLWDDFKHRILLAQQAMAQALVGEPSHLTLSADLHPTVVSIIPPGGTAPTTTPNEEWLNRLYAAFGQTTSATEQFNELKTSEGSRVASYGNLTTPQTAGYFGAQGQAEGKPAPAKSSAPVLLALAGAAALLLAGKK